MRHIDKRFVVEATGGRNGRLGRGYCRHLGLYNWTRASVDLVAWRAGETVSVKSASDKLGHVACETDDWRH